MAKLTLEQAQIILTKTLEKGHEMGLNPLTVAVVDDGGSLKAFAREDGPGAALRPQIATGKAFGAVGMGISSRKIGDIALDRPHFGVAGFRAGQQLRPLAGTGSPRQFGHDPSVPLIIA